MLIARSVTYNQGLPQATDGDPFPDLNPERPLPVLIRATNGKSKAKRSQKIKFSTLVEAHEIESFYSRYADVCKTGMGALKPRDRSKKRSKAKKKKATTISPN